MMMNTDDDVLAALDESFAGVHLDRPVETIVAGGCARRRRQRLAVTAAAVATAAAIGVVGALTVVPPASDKTAVVPQSAASQSPGDGLVHVHLASFNVDQNADNTVSLVVNTKQDIDVPGLRDALTRAKVPTVFSMFPAKGHEESTPKECLIKALPLIDQVLSGRPGFVWVIHLDKMPPGSVLWIQTFQRGARTDGLGISVQYKKDIPVTCHV